MNIIYVLVLVLGTAIHMSMSPADADTGPKNCGPLSFEVPTTWQDETENCTLIMKKQVLHEVDASLHYMAMGAHFARDSINRPGFSELFFKSASEEREHAIKIMEYLLMRGEVFKDYGALLPESLPVPKQTWTDGTEALQDALYLEANVTVNIKKIIKKCEKPEPLTQFNNYHLVDYLTGVFLEEQYTGQREIAGKLSTLGKMKALQGNLGEFLFDKKLLNGEL